MRWVRVRVLPEPGPAMIITGPSVAFTASACSSFRLPRIRSFASGSGSTDGLSGVSRERVILGMQTAAAVRGGESEKDESNTRFLYDAPRANVRGPFGTPDALRRRAVFRRKTATPDVH